jgi:membrane protein YdbS with pleckstrin-like domain
MAGGGLKGVVPLRSMLSPSGFLASVGVPLGHLPGADAPVVSLRMGYPKRLLSDDEVIEAEFRPHWSGIIREGLILVAGLAAAVLVFIFEWPAWLYAVIAGLVVLLVIGGIVKWANTLHVVTNERLIYRAGFIAKQGTEIPLEVIQNVAFNQTMFERLFGTGDLLIESAGTHGQTRYRDIPRPEAIQSLIYRMREVRMRTARAGAIDDPDSSLSQLERLSRLHDQGKLSDEEFEAQKTRLLGGNN